MDNTGYFIGIDIGTSSIKTDVYNESFELILECSDKYGYSSNEKEWTEIDPTIWTTHVHRQLSQIFEKISCQLIKGIGITGQMHTTVFLDQDHQPLRPAIMWNDKRTANIIEKIKAELKRTKQTKSIFNILSTGSPLANLIWLMEFEPVNYQRLGKILIAKDYVRYVLTGELLTDYCDASTSSLYDVIEEKWSEEVIETFQIKPSIFPEVNYASNFAGNLDLSLFGIEEQVMIPIVVGTGDNVASVIANQSQNQPIFSLGTSGVVILTNQENQWLTTGKNILAKISANDQRIVTQGALQSGAKVIEWWSKNIVYQDVTQFEEKLTEKLGENQVLFLPYLNGDKTLFKNCDLCGAFYGLNLNHDQTDFTLAVYEGVAFAMKRLLQQMQTEEQQNILLIGGGAKSKIWPKIFANILDKTICINRVSHEASCGAAMLAYYQLYQKFPELRNEIQEIKPEKKLAKNYQKKYQAFINFSNALIKKERR